LGDWTLISDDHRHQLLVAASFLVFTVGAGVASIYSAWFSAPRRHEVRSQAKHLEAKGDVEAKSDQNLPSSLQIRLGSVLSNQFDFAIVSTGPNEFVVKNLYLRLLGYAKCPLRNEMSILGAMLIPTRYSVQLSPEYARYDLPSLASPGDTGVWTYTGSSDQFGIEVVYTAYILFVVSIQADGDDLTANKPFHVSSDVINFIEVEHGNYGGCLELSSWYHPAMLRLPVARSYLKGASVLAQQLLTVDVSQNSSFLFKTRREQLARVLPEIEGISTSRPANTVFSRNLREVQSVLSKGRRQK
jgi:hypothetical protein